MAKRIADKELTDRNWDQEEEGEEAGTFSVASEDVLKGRAIKKAKRRTAGSEAESGAAFKSFKGFSPAPSAAAAAPSMFSGFGNGGFKASGGVTNGNATSFSGFSFTATTPAPTFGSYAKPSADLAANQTNGSAPSAQSNKEYSRQLTALNCSVRDWITKHVNDNPLCDLNPIFRDYERHLSSIERQYGGSEETKPPPPASSSPPPAPPTSGPAPPAPALFSFAKSSTEESTPPRPAGVSFNFGQKVDGSVLGALASKPAAPGFSFSPSSSGQTSAFGAPGPAAPPSFSGTKAEDARPSGENGDEESEEPPKAEVKEVKEDDAFYSKKCKLFYKKDSEFKEKGVGTLHLKETPEGKTQLIIRADTNLGNILLNIMLQASMPCSRVGKNNVMVVCVPNPCVDDKNPSSPVPLLIRVKTGEDADQLHRTLEEKKG